MCGFAGREEQEEEAAAAEEEEGGQNKFYKRSSEALHTCLNFREYDCVGPTLGL